MSLYLDASVLVASVVVDDLTPRARAFLSAQSDLLVVSDFAVVEFASAVGRRVRMGRNSEDEARRAFSALDTWVAKATEPVEAIPADMTAATAILRRLDLTIRTGDALNIAIAIRLDASLATFDEKMAWNARALGATVAAA